MTYLMVDAHEDLAWNMHEYNRDYNRSAYATRRIEPAEHTNGQTLLGKPEWLLGHVGIIFATLFAVPAHAKFLPSPKVTYSDQQTAHNLLSAQLDTYHRLTETSPTFALVDSVSRLHQVLETWAADKNIIDRQIGFVPLMEGADALRHPSELDEWYQRGLRIIGPAWKATAYAGGTGQPGPFTDLGVELLEAMQTLNMMLDLSHLSEQAYLQAIDTYEGPIAVTHANPRHFLPTDRGISDKMIRLLAERDGVLGVVPYNVFMKPGWAPTDQPIALSLYIDIIDHVCQLTGSSKYVGIGTDFDGGFGRLHVPTEIDTIADLQCIPSHLQDRGYTHSDISAIMSNNWLRKLEQALPED